MQTPPLDRQILEWLKEAFPQKLPHPKGNERSDLFHAGQQDVIATYERKLIEQEDE